METKKKRERHSAAFKAKVAIDAIKEKETLQELSSKYKVSAVTISKWKAEFLSNSALAFSGEADATKKEEAHEKQVKELRAKIGELTMEREIPTNLYLWSGFSVILGRPFMCNSGFLHI